jgi:hypothetical protein
MGSSGSLLRMQDTLRSGHEGHMSVVKQDDKGFAR